MKKLLESYGADIRKKHDLDPKESFAEVFSNYSVRLNLNLEMLEQESFHCVYAWAFPQSFAGRTEASQNLLVRQHRPDLAKRWSETILSYPVPQNPHVPLRASAVFSYFGGVNNIELLQQSIHPFFSMMIAGQIETDKARATDHASLLRRNICVYAQGGHLSAPATVNFIEELQRIKSIDQSTAEKLIEEVRSSGTSIPLSRGILGAILGDSQSDTLAVHFFLKRDFKSYRLQLHGSKEITVAENITTALELREHGRFDEIVELEKSILKEVEPFSRIPVSVVLCETFLFLGNQEKAELYHQYIKKFSSKESIFLTYLKEFKVSLLIAQNNIAGATEELKYIPRAPRLGFYRFTLEKMLFEKTYSGLECQ